LKIWWKQVEEIIDRALAEDLSGGDITTQLLIPGELQGKASLTSRASGVLAGIEIAGMVFQRVDPSLSFQVLLPDSTRIKPGDTLATVKGTVASILKAERTALNFLQHLSGIASATSRFVEAIKGLPVYLLDTRKTIPGLRVLEKYAVRMGGGRNHRLHLGDGILIKDNHLAVLRSRGESLKEAIERIRREAPPGLKIEVEADTVEQALEAVAAGADIVMLDNMSLEEIRRTVKLAQGRALLEASGGVTLDRVRAIADTGVNFISVGAITHSAPALDISLELDLGSREE
jgi:nicotinate-nucleotide pyrophosphorylase (carboxylating)